MTIWTLRSLQAGNSRLELVDKVDAMDAVDKAQLFVHAVHSVHNVHQLNEVQLGKIYASLKSNLEAWT